MLLHIYLCLSDTRNGGKQTESAGEHGAEEGVECEDEVTGRIELCSVERRSGPSPNFINDHVNLCELKLLVNPLNPELNPICCLLALLGAHHFLHVSRIRVKFLTLRLLMSYIYIYIYIYIYVYMEHPFLMFLDHTQRHTTVGRAPLDE